MPSYVTMFVIVGLASMAAFLFACFQILKLQRENNEQHRRSVEQNEQLASLSEDRKTLEAERTRLQTKVGHLEERSSNLSADIERIHNEKFHFAIMRDAAEINSFISAIVSEFETLLSKRAVHLTFEPADGPTTVLLDHYLFDRMLFHLLANAVDKTPRGGEVKIKAKVDSGRLAVAVRDGFRGTAAVEQAAPRPLFSTNQTLALVKRFAEMHGGSVVVHSRSDGGMTVAINIDAPTASAEPASCTGFGLSRLSAHREDQSSFRLQKLLHERSEQLATANEELRWLTRELQVAREHALAAAEAKANFLANMSHEIRTPLNGLIVTCELLLESGLTEGQIEYVNISRESALALLDTVNDVLDFSRMEDQKLNLDLMEFDVLGLVEGAAQLLSNRARQKNISLMTHVATDVPRRLYGDPTRLRQILINLMGNGIKFTEHGEVVCRVTCESISPARAVLRFVVADTGIGLPEDMAETLFEPFMQRHNGTTRKYTGTGLGLSISNRLIELMGGRIGVASAEGRGATFWFTVPFEYKPVEPMAQLVDSLKNLRMLVVDGRRGSQSIVLDYAESWGLNCTAVEGGTEGLKLMRDAVAEDRPFDLVIIDFDITDVHPFAFARYIRTTELNECRLILLTSSDEEGRGAKALRCGFHAYLTKPVRQSDLFDCLANLTLCAKVYRGPARFEEIAVNGRVPSASEHVQQARALSARGKKLILVVEDNSINQKVARLQLEEFGYYVDVVNNGAEALLSIEKLDYDLVLMDCAMPIMDGYEATRRIRKMDALSGKHTKIVALTAHSLPGDREKCLACGMDDYLSKPVSAVQLRDTLDRWLNKTKNSHANDSIQPTGKPS